MEEATGAKVASIENHPFLRDFEDGFGEIVGFPPKRDIDLYIDLMSRVSSMSKKPYIMGKT
jgi:hypothetical protein